jgi:hypothetical protein
MLTKKAQLGVEEKKKKEKKIPSENTVLTPTRRQKPTHKSPTAAGMRKYNRSVKPKKDTVLRLNERKKKKFAIKNNFDIFVVFSRKFDKQFENN